MSRALLPAACLLLLAGCQQPGPAVPRPYAAAEEGLTLIYINPSLPEGDQAAQRLQVRVDKVADREDGAKLVTKSFTLGLQPPFQSTFASRDGGLSLVGPDGKSELPLLPEHFPDGASSWSRGAVSFRILGRGAWMKAAKTVPDDRMLEGVWVEADSARGPVSRTLYLPGLGEVQTDERRPDGSWATVNLLTQYGFLDSPEPASGEPPAAPPAAVKPAKKRAAKPDAKPDAKH